MRKNRFKIYYNLENGLGTTQACAEVLCRSFKTNAIPHLGIYPLWFDYTMIKLPQNTHPEHHFFQQFRYDAHLMFYCHDETHAFSKPTEAMDSFREGITRDFLNRVRCKLGLRDTELIFLACSEYGKANIGHVHVLISLDPLRRNGRSAPKLAQAQERLNKAVADVESQMFKDAIKVTIKNIGKELSDSTDCLTYVCKHEPGHPFKSFFYSKWFKATRKATDS